MSKHDKESLSDINVDEIIFITFKTICIVALIWFSLWVYFCVYKPQEKRYTKHTKNAYVMIEKEAREIFRKDKQIYTENDTVDSLCEALAKKYKSRTSNCQVSKRGALIQNFTFGKTKVAVYGMNMPAFSFNGTLVKDIIIDIDGEKGKNEFGIDRTPVRIYSSGRMGGMLSPVNCKVEDIRRYGFDRSALCPSNHDVNYFATNVPLNYNIIQIGGKGGESRYVGKNISFLRADCTAYGSELLGMDEYCEHRQYQWLTACYHDYYCAIEIAKD